MLKDAERALVGDHVDSREIGRFPSNGITVKARTTIGPLKHSLVSSRMLDPIRSWRLLPRRSSTRIPGTNDQPGVAAESPTRNPGMFVPLKKLTAPFFPSVDEVVNDPTYRNNDSDFSH